MKKNITTSLQQCWKKFRIPALVKKKIVEDEEPLLTVKKRISEPRDEITQE